MARTQRRDTYPQRLKKSHITATSNKVQPPWSGQNVWRWLLTFYDEQQLQDIQKAWVLDTEEAKDAKNTIATPFKTLHLVACLSPQQGQAQHLDPGFHRLEVGLDAPLLTRQVLLTLCVGQVADTLKELEFEADVVSLHATATPWNRWTVQALARCCRRGTQVWVESHAESQEAEPSLMVLLSQAGFVAQASPSQTAPQTAATPNTPPQTSALSAPALSYTYDPQWDIKTQRRIWRSPAQEPGHCTVLGAGLAGASVAYALARRGWRVLVLDAASMPAAGASGLPAGLMAPQDSRDDSPRSRLIRAGIELTHQHAQRLLIEGQDWAPTGVMTLQMAEDLADNRTETWHPSGAWIRPGQLVRAWLAHPLITFQGHTYVARISHEGPQSWKLWDTQDQLINTSSCVVLANAGGAFELAKTCTTPLTKLPAMEQLQGVLSWGYREAEDPNFAMHPVNGYGSLIPKFPMPEGWAWITGATYEVPRNELELQQHHQHNLERLRQLQPRTAEALSENFEQNHVQHWVGTRCVNSKRLPCVGSLEASGLWIHAALGSRGLSLSALGAELLASRIGAEPWPLPKDLAQHLMVDG